MVHQIKAHDPNFDYALINNKFIDGLKPEIKSVVFMHKPIDLDTASSLALLQEELTLEYPEEVSEELIHIKGVSSYHQDHRPLMPQVPRLLLMQHLKRKAM